jgi:hypothetical protein
MSPLCVESKKEEQGGKVVFKDLIRSKEQNEDDDET